MIPRPRLFQPVDDRQRVVGRRSSERLLVGSSKTMTRALDTSARATSTNCWAPTPRLPTLASGRMSG